MTPVLITGANRGIGLALAQEAAARGLAVIAAMRQPPARAGHVALEITDPSSIAALGRSVSGPLGLLVCNAGIYEEDDRDPGAWAKTFAVNVTGIALLVQALQPALVRGRGKIAIVASNMGSSARAPGGSLIYRASKAAAINLGRNLATDLRDKRIAVGIYHPGWVQTEMGGDDAEITPAASARGLMDRFAALSMETTGIWEDWQGQPLRF